MKAIWINKHFIMPSLLMTTVLLIQGCGTITQYKPLPSNLENHVQMPGFKDIRAWGDMPSPSLEKNAKQSLTQERQANHGQLAPSMTALALSGGGSDGAFGAGFICGWTASGSRPNFKLVTGISTGALMAPFVFLGPSYDAQLKEVYTTISDDKIYKPYSAFSILLSIINLQSLPSMASNKPLAALIKKNVGMTMLHKIAAEHLKGRRLLIGTSQVNAQRLVIWNMGEIATVGTPEALALFQQIMLASSSLPVSFPPQYFTVEAQGQLFQEMHFDGGLEAQVMLYENAIAPFAEGLQEGSRAARPRKLYIIRNEKIYPEWQNVKPELKQIAIRSIDTLTKSQGLGDTYRLYTYSQRDNIEYNLVFIPSSWKEVAKTPFDNQYMRELFAYGYRLGKINKSWVHYPPGYDPQ